MSHWPLWVLAIPFYKPSTLPFLTEKSLQKQSQQTSATPPPHARSCSQRSGSVPRGPPTTSRQTHAHTVTIHSSLTRRLKFRVELTCTRSHWWRVGELGLEQRQFAPDLSVAQVVFQSEQKSQLFLEETRKGKLE